jgi:hypothetical protein
VICCKECAYFIADKIGDGSGIGRCKCYSQYKASGAPENALKMLLIELGSSPNNELFWGGTIANRECNRYKKIRRKSRNTKRSK